ncbi:hypothetical protein LZ31DRAFT_623923 [Colletotrichum somersetense]|nr:hypothetical protein LZ31DRAFT_623923 [Colletotrichum somersetense]
MVSLPTDSRKPLAIGVASAFIVIIIIFMSLRVYIRGYKMRRAWKLDDTMFILSSIITIGQCIVVILCAVYGGLGLHLWKVSFIMIKSYNLYGMIVALAYNISFGFIKATFLLQHRRAFALPSVMRICDILLGVLVLTSVPLLITYGVFTSRLFYGSLIPDHTTFKNVRTITYITGAAHLLSDIIIFILPIAVLGQMRLTKTQKISLYASFGVGIFTSAISIFKIVTAHEALVSIDPFYGTVPVILLSTAEPTSAVVFACVPLMGQLFRCGSARKDSNGSSGSYLINYSENCADKYQMRLEHNLQLQSPTSLTIPTHPQMARISKTEGSIDDNVEDYHLLQSHFNTRREIV